MRFLTGSGKRPGAMWSKCYKKLIFYSGLIFLICGSGYTDEDAFGDYRGYSPRVGEVLSYKVIAKSFIYGADQKVKVVSKGVFANRNVFNVEYTFNTIGLVWSLTKYHEREELVLDEEGLYPLFTKREIFDNGKLLIEETNFDYARGYAIRTVTNSDGNKNTSEIKLPGFVQDSLSLQFFLRKQLFEEGRKRISIYYFGTVEEIEYEITKINEPIKLEYGSYPRYYQITSDQAKITVYFTDNEEHIPLVIKKSANFGKVEARLSKIE